MCKEPSLLGYDAMLIGRYRRFRNACCLHLQGLNSLRTTTFKLRQQAPMKYQQLYTRLYVVMSQELEFSSTPLWEPQTLKQISDTTGV
jgi:hypothetical protein